MSEPNPELDLDYLYPEITSFDRQRTAEIGQKYFPISHVLLDILGDMIREKDILVSDMGKIYRVRAVAYTNKNLCEYIAEQPQGGKNFYYRLLLWNNEEVTVLRWSDDPTVRLKESD